MEQLKEDYLKIRNTGLQLKEDYLKIEARRNSLQELYDNERAINISLMTSIKVLRTEKEALVEILIEIQKKYGVAANKDISDFLNPTRDVSELSNDNST